MRWLPRCGRRGKRMEDPTSNLPSPGLARVCYIYRYRYRYINIDTEKDIDIDIDIDISRPLRRMPGAGDEVN